MKTISCSHLCEHKDEILLNIIFVKTPYLVIKKCYIKVIKIVINSYIKMNFSPYLFLNIGFNCTIIEITMICPYSHPAKIYLSGSSALVEAIMLLYLVKTYLFSKLFRWCMNFIGLGFFSLSFIVGVTKYIRLWWKMFNEVAESCKNILGMLVIFIEVILPTLPILTKKWVWENHITFTLK